jgi:hypothetical protein
LMGQLVSRRIECRRSMHDWGDVASDALVDIFASMRPDPARRDVNNSKDCQMKRMRSGHDAPASNQGCCS